MARGPSDDGRDGVLTGRQTVAESRAGRRRGPRLPDGSRSGASSVKAAPTTRQRAARPETRSPASSQDSPPGAGALTPGHTHGSSPSRSKEMKTDPPSGSSSSTHPTPCARRARAVTRVLPRARASATSLGRALPTPRKPTWKMSPTCSISLARRMGEEYPWRTPAHLVAEVEMGVHLDHGHRPPAFVRGEDRDGDRVVAAQDDRHHVPGRAARGPQPRPASRSRRRPTGRRRRRHNPRCGHRPPASAGPCRSRGGRRTRPAARNGLGSRPARRSTRRHASRAGMAPRTGCPGSRGRRWPLPRSAAGRSRKVGALTVGNRTPPRFSPVDPVPSADVRPCDEAAHGCSRRSCSGSTWLCLHVRAGPWRLGLFAASAWAGARPGSAGGPAGPVA